MERSFYKTMLDHLYDGVYFVDCNRKILYWNCSAEKLSGYSAADMVGSFCYDNRLNHTNNAGVLLCQCDKCPLAKTLKDGCLREAELYLQHKTGHRVPVSVRISPIRDADNKIIGAVEIFSDNSSKSRLLQQLERFKELSLIDMLTGLGNRRFGEIKLATKLEEMHKVSEPLFGVLFADIDHFKRVNDQYGHDVGDKVLEMVAKTMQNGVGDAGSAFRWGGEEFMIIIYADSHQQLAVAAERIRALIERSELRLCSECIKVTITIGAALATLSDTEETLIKRADELLYQGKNSGRNKVVVDE